MGHLRLLTHLLKQHLEAWALDDGGTVVYGAVNSSQLRLQSTPLSEEKKQKHYPCTGFRLENPQMNVRQNRENLLIFCIGSIVKFVYVRAFCNVSLFLESLAQPKAVSRYRHTVSVRQHGFNCTHEVKGKLDHAMIA